VGDSRFNILIPLNRSVRLIDSASISRTRLILMMGWLHHFLAVWLFGNHSGRRLAIGYAAVCCAAATRFQSERLVSERETQRRKMDNAALFTSYTGR
jgi:hypothetical protein